MRGKRGFMAALRRRRYLLESRSITGGSTAAAIDSGQASLSSPEVASDMNSMSLIPCRNSSNAARLRLSSARP